MEGEKKKGLFRVGKFRFENEHVEKWVNLGSSINTDYEYELRPTGITPLNPTEGLLKFTFEIELLPDKGKISFNGDCYLFSNNLKALIMILKADENSIIRKKNQAFMKALCKLLLRRCLDHAKNVGEKEGIHFPNYEYVLQQWGIEHISFKNEEKKILSLKGDSLIPKHKLKTKLGKYKYKHLATFPKPIILRNIRFKGILYDKIIFDRAMVYSEEKLPPTCLHQPDVYKISIIEYNPKNKSTKLFVMKRK